MTTGKRENSKLGHAVLAVATLPVLGFGYLAGHLELIDEIPFGTELKQRIKATLGLDDPAGVNETVKVRNLPRYFHTPVGSFTRQPVPFRAAFLFNQRGKGPRADLFQTTTINKTRRDPGKEFLARKKLYSPGGIKTARIRYRGKSDRLDLAPQQQAMASANMGGHSAPYAQAIKSPLVIAAATGLPELPEGRNHNGRRLDPYEAEKLAIRQAAMRPRLLQSGRAFGGLTEEEFRRREMRCLTTAIYFEARGEPIRGQLAVAQVIMNRVRSPEFPDTICGVIFQGEHRKNACQFSFACDGQADRPSNKAQWEMSKRIARQVTGGEVWLDDIGYATHYHATYVSPEWRHSLKRVKKIGRHIFYIAKRAAVTETFQKLYTPSLKSGNKG